jgi:hypothetical protein
VLKSVLLVIPNNSMKVTSDLLNPLDGGIHSHTGCTDNRFSYLIGGIDDPFDGPSGRRKHRHIRGKLGVKDTR